MTFAPQNWRDRLIASGRSIEERAEGVANGLAQSVGQSARISVDGVASAIEGATTELRGATVDLANSINGLTGQSISDTIGGAVSGLANNALNGITSQINGALGGLLGGIFGGAKQPNPLDQYASYNYEITLGCLTAFEVNLPDFTYRRREPFITVLRSSGGDTRGSRTLYETGGKTEYFIDDLTIDSIIAPTNATRLTSAHSLNFTILEPYSMGMFLEALQVAALTAGHKNYIDAPYCLVIQFKGWDDFGRPITVPNTRRVYPLKFVDINFKVDEGGSTYAVTAIPFNEIALTDENQASHTDIQIQGRTVAEMLQTGGESLATILNNRELQKVEASQNETANQYVIMFPTETSSAEEALLAGPENNDGATTESSSDSESAGMRELTEEQKQRLYESITGIQNGEVPADFDAELEKIAGIVVRRSEYGEQIREYAEKEENINDIGQAQLVRSNLDGGTQPMATPNLSENEDTPGEFDRCRIGRSQDLRCMTFSPGKRVQDMIEQVILASEFGRSAATAEADENGMVNWFRIEAQVYLVGGSEQVDRTGEQAKIFVYRVVPYKVHRSTFQAPTQSSPGIQNLFRQAVKEYNYIYTGKNKDIIDFDIRFDLAFYTGVHGDLGQLAADSQQGGAQEIAGGNDRSTTTVPDGNTETLPNGRMRPNVPRENRVDGGGLTLHPENIVGMNFNENLVNNPVDLVMVDLTIVGDPYYMADSGIGNYNSPTLGSLINLTADGTMAYQESEVDIEVNFRTPLDYGPNGWMEFPGLGSQPVRKFNGLYKVIFVKHNFSQGQFTQTLELIRRRAQDIAAEQAAVQNTGAVELADSDRQIAQTPEISPSGSGSSQGGTGGQGSQGTPSSSSSVQGGRGTVNERPGERATYTESQRISRVQSARANGANVGF
jgi:hypothetical protein